MLDLRAKLAHKKVAGAPIKVEEGDVIRHLLLRDLLKRYEQVRGHEVRCLVVRRGQTDHISDLLLGKLVQIERLVGDV